MRRNIEQITKHHSSCPLKSNRMEQDGQWGQDDEHLSRIQRKLPGLPQGLEME